MGTSLRDLMAERVRQSHATDVGTEMHIRMQRISIDAPRPADVELVGRIRACPGLVEFFGPNSRPEVPVAGTIRGRFISRRIDRMIIDTAQKTIRILDYKTDVTHDANRDKYIAQIGEYIALVRRIYPDYAVSGYILWLHDWTLERVDIA